MFRPLLFRAATFTRKVRVCLTATTRPAILGRARKPASRANRACSAKPCPPAPDREPLRRRPATLLSAAPDRPGSALPAILAEDVQPAAVHRREPAWPTRASRPARQGFLPTTSQKPSRFVTPRGFTTPARPPFRRSGTSPHGAGTAKLGTDFVDRKWGKRFPRAIHAGRVGLIGKSGCKSPRCPRLDAALRAITRRAAPCCTSGRQSGRCRDGCAPPARRSRKKSRRARSGGPWTGSPRHSPPRQSCPAVRTGHI